MLFKEAHLKFLNYLEVIKNKSPRTIEQYDRHLRKFNEFIIEKSPLSISPNGREVASKIETFDVSNINLDIAEKFRSYLYEKNRTISIKTANAYMITLRSFLKFLEKK
ncbi:site-specific integrase [Patescibacteria group bacterium]